MFTTILCDAFGWLGSPLLQATPTSFELVPFIETVYKNMIAQTGGITAMVEGKIRGAAGVAALLYIFSRVIGQISRNESIDFFPLLRPFALMMMIAMAPKICDAMDQLGKELLSVGISQKDSIQQKVRDHFVAMEEAKMKKADEQANAPSDGLLDAFKDTASAVANGFMDLPQKLFTWLLYLIQILLQAVFFICYSLMYLFSVAYRIILRLGAPIVFVMAIFPGFTGNMVNWFAKYLNFCLLPFVSAMYGTLSFSVLNAFLTQYDPAASVASDAELSQIALMGITYIGVLIMCIIGYFQVPSMTEMLISVGGVGALAQGAQNAAKQSASTAKSAAAIPKAAATAAVATSAAVVGASMRSFGGGGSGAASQSSSGGGGRGGGSSSGSGAGNGGGASPNRADLGGSSAFAGSGAASGVPVSSSAATGTSSGGSAGGSSGGATPNVAGGSGGVTGGQASEPDPYERVPSSSSSSGGGAASQSAASSPLSSSGSSFQSQAAADDPYEAVASGKGESTPPPVDNTTKADVSAPSTNQSGPQGARSGNAGTIARNVPAAYRAGQQMGGRMAGYLGGTVAGTYAFLTGGNGIDDNVRQAYGRGQEVASRVGGAVGGVLFGAGMAAGEVGRFGYNVVGGAVSNYKALTSEDPATGNRRDMPMRYRTMVDKNQQANQPNAGPNSFTS